MPAAPRVVTSLLGATLVAAGCVTRARPSDDPVARRYAACSGPATVTVRNNTPQALEVYELRGRAQTFVGEAGPGVQRLTVAPKDGANYGARAAGAVNAPWLALASNPGWGDGRVRLERVCEGA